ncbi:MAG: peptidoglycan editing factor PgeF [Rhodocyclaceae bacterium]|nr:peptidoglycan editing factor PgeF [Rhodocyclaceae bacterium]
MSEFLVPDWPAPRGVRALVTTRAGGVSAGPWSSFNLGDHVGDDYAAVLENRRRLRTELPDHPKWLNQVHGIACVDATELTMPVEADASFTRKTNVVCAVLTADCLPVLLCDESATVVAIAHAGWRGLAAGVLESTIKSMQIDPQRLLAWLGPAIGPDAFEVGGEVRNVFVEHDAQAEQAFVSHANDKWTADLCELARLRLSAMGIRRVTSTNWCTATNAQQFYSYRRDGITGRMASCIWLA